VARRLGERGVAMLDAPVSAVWRRPRRHRSPSLSAETRLSSNARGRCWHAGQGDFPHGPAGTGQVTKLANQIAQLACLQGAAEALLFAREQGADAAKGARQL